MDHGGRASVATSPLVGELAMPRPTQPHAAMGRLNWMAGLLCRFSREYLTICPEKEESVIDQQVGDHRVMV
jgi:hypothetical protein